MVSKSFDFRSLNRYFSPNASGDLNRFLERLPQHAGNTALIAAGIVWCAAAGLGLFAMMQTKQLTELRGKLQSTEALQPIVPTIAMIPVDTTELTGFVDGIKPVYEGLTISSNNNTVIIQSRDTSLFSQFREALSHVGNGGSGWKVRLESFCIGRECKQNPLDATLKVEKMNISQPQPAAPEGEAAAQ